jgi:hypothetical protein
VSLGAVAGFGEIGAPSTPIGALAGFEPEPGAAGFEGVDPGGAMAGFAPDKCANRYLWTVPRSTPRVRAISRCDRPCACNVNMDCKFAILSRFGIESLLPRHCRKKTSRPKLSFLKMAGFHAPITGWF